MGIDSSLTSAFGETEALAFKEDVKWLKDSIQKVKSEVGKRIVGQKEMVHLSIATVLAGGNVSLIGKPGLAKTLFVNTLAEATGIKSDRIQFTPDTMPSDITGYEMLDAIEKVLKFVEGPAFTELLLADEINRGSPRTQSSLLEAMQEKQVTVNGTPRSLGELFHVLATQNPIEQEGTNPLPEAQLDRFLTQVDLPYPTAEEEMIIADMDDFIEVNAVISRDDLIRMERLVKQARKVFDPEVKQFAVNLVRSLRPESEEFDLKEVNDSVGFGPGPRASQALIKMATAQALMDGRLVASIDDIKELAIPVLKHRMALDKQFVMTQNGTEDALKIDLINKMVDHVDGLRGKKPVPSADLRMK